MVIQGIVTALSVGMGCGTCCGSGISVFLFSYLTTHAGTVKHSIRAFLCFYLGKILAVAGVCACSSLIGRQLLDENGSVGDADLHIIVNLCMIAIGVWFVIKWIREKIHTGCEHCDHCGSSSGWKERFMQKISGMIRMSDDTLRADNGCAVIDRAEAVQGKPVIAGKLNYPALFVMGALYGISPCAPLLMMAGYAATLGAVPAFMAGCIFAAASAFVPMLLLLFLTGILTSKLYKEIPQYISIFRLISYLLLIVLFAVTL